MTTKLKKRRQIILWRCIAAACLLSFLLSATHVIFAENFNIIIGSIFMMTVSIARLLLLSNMRRIDSPIISPYSTDSYWAYRASESLRNHSSGSNTIGRGIPYNGKTNYPYY